MRTYFPNSFRWDKIFKNGQSEICGRQPLKNLTISLQILYRLSCTNFTWSILEYLSQISPACYYLYYLCTFLCRKQFLCSWWSSLKKSCCYNPANLMEMFSTTYGPEFSKHFAHKQNKHEYLSFCNRIEQFLLTENRANLLHTMNNHDC